MKKSEIISIIQEVVSEELEKESIPGEVDHFKSEVAFNSIKAGDTVTILSAHKQEQTGRAVMYNPKYSSWVLNLRGSRHGTPIIATAENVVRVRNKKHENISEESIGNFSGGGSTHLESNLKKFFGDFPLVKVELDFKQLPPDGSKYIPYIAIHTPTQDWYWDDPKFQPRIPEFNGIVSSFHGDYKVGHKIIIVYPHNVSKYFRRS